MRHRPNKLKPNQTLSEQTIANHLRTLNAILNFLSKKGKISGNPYNDVNNKPDPKNSKRELIYFKINEAIYALKCLQKFANIRLKAFMNIIFSLGCRREEACGLCWCDIDFTTGEVNYNFAQTSSVPNRFLRAKIERDKLLKNNINSGKNYKRIRTKKLKTKNSYRTNFLSDIAIDCLKKYYQFKIACGINVKPTDFIFTTYRNGRNIDKNDINLDYLLSDNNPIDPNKLSEQWKDFKKLYQIKNVDLHRIRHTVANILEKKVFLKRILQKCLVILKGFLNNFILTLMLMI